MATVEERFPDCGFVYIREKRVFWKKDESKDCGFSLHESWGEPTRNEVSAVLTALYAHYKGKGNK